MANAQARREIRLVEEEDGWWSAIDVRTDVASQGQDAEEAVANLKEAVDLYSGDTGEEIEDEAAFLRELGIEVDEERGRELPSFMS